MSPWRTVALVAGREITTKARSKGYRIITALMVAGIVVGGVLIHFATGTSPEKVGLLPETRSLQSALEQLAGSDGGEGVQTTEVADRAAGEELVRKGKLDALLAGSPDDIEVVVKRDLASGLKTQLTVLSQQQALASAITGLGGDPATVAQQLLTAAPKVTELQPRQTDPAKVVAAYLSGILVYVSMMSVGQIVAQSVVEEKSTRVVELLLATLRPWQLLAGKVIGLGLVGLVQIGLVVAAGTVTAMKLGLVHTGSVDVAAVAGWTLVWFVIGFATYSVVLAGLASLVSRQEEVASVIAPFTVAMVVPYVIGVSIGTTEPNSRLMQWLSFLPFTAPFDMPIRVAGGGVPGWQVALSAAVSIALIPVLAWAAGRVYGHAVLQTGARVGLRRAFRG